MAGTDSVLNLKINTIMDVSDVKHNVDEIQKSFSKLKLPDKLGDSLKKNISDFNKEYEKYQKKVAEGIHTQGDKTAVNKSLNSMLNSYEKIINEFSKMSKKDFKDIFNLDTGAFEKVQSQIKQLQTNLNKIKLDPNKISGPLKEIQNLTSSKRLTKDGGILDRLMGSFKANDFNQAKQAFSELEKYYNQYQSKMSDSKRTGLQTQLEAIRTELDRVEREGGDARTAMSSLEDILNGIGLKGSGEFQKIAADLDRTKTSAESLTEELKRQHEQEFNFNNEVKNIDRQIQSYFGLSQIIRKVGNIARDAFSTVKELDAAMVETAVVTNFDVGDMWDMLPMYTENANALGSTIKDVYEAATLYYQQGLNQAQAMGLARETLKMARIGGLEAAEATDMMTAALRGFNMQINELSAQKINDVYSELAAITASDTKEIGSAMERTASIASSANMEFETTSAFLAQMIETTREAPENLGTAMKTIIARFQEMKQDPTKLIDSEGVMMDANRVDKALKTIGVNLMNQKGEFRDLDDVFLDIAAKWDSLTQGQQRYIATIAAGSRQQSRFIAMMSNYDRTMELVEAANNSAGASQRQFEKTLEGMDSKLNKLQNAWNQFAMGLMNNQIIKFGVDALTGALSVINKIIDTIGKISPKPFEGLTKSILTLIATFAGLNLARTGLTGVIQGGVGWWKNETGKGLIGSIAGAVKDQSRTGINSQQLGKKDGKIYGQFWKLSVNQEIARQNEIKRAQPKDFLNFKQAFGNISSSMTKGMGPQLEANIRKTFENAFTQVNSNIIGEKEGQELINGYIEKIRAGELSVREAMEQLNQKVVGRGGQAIDTGQVLTPILKQTEPQFGKISGTINKFGSATTNAGNALVDLGVALSTIHPALAPLGTTLTTVGTLMASLGSTITLVVGEFAKAGGGMAGLAAIWTLPLVKVIAVVSALIIAYKVLDALIVTNKERLEAASDAAAAASDAYSSAKQETSELADNINRIKEADAGFEGLVAGTAAFNEQLVESNQLILDLINKYPMLNDYLTIDKNGRMKISDEGFEAVTDYQKQIQSRAAALNTQKNAELEAEKTRQEIDKLTKTTTYTGPSHRPVEIQKTLTEEEQRQLDILEKQYDTQKQSAALNAARTTISSQELANQEAIAGLYASQYEDLKKTVTLGSKEDNYKKYAEYYGYSYEGGKLLDVEGNEVNVDYDTIKNQIPDITVLMDFEANAKSLDTTIESINDKFNDEIGDGFEGSDHFISDVLSNSVEANEDLIQKILTDDQALVDTVQSMSADSIATILNVDKATVSSNLSKYQQDLIDLIHGNAENIGQAQAEEYADLAAMMGEAQYGSDYFSKRGRDARTIVEDGKKVQEDITKQLQSLNASQRRSLLKAGQALQQSAGKDSMAIIINGMKDIYNDFNTLTDKALNNTITDAEQTALNETQAAVNEMQSLIDNVNWDSPTDRLAAYKQMTESTIGSVKDLGNELLNSNDSANLLGEAFEEVYDSEDFQKLLEDVEDFTDTAGNFNASGIMKMAEQSSALNNLLKTGEITAGGFALAMNTLHGEGDISLLSLNQDVLKLLSSFAQLDSVMASAHETVSNFDPGIDTGEGEDFIKENIEKYNEYYENGEWGNPQMEAYAKLIVGEDRWLEALKANNGNLEDTFNQFNSKIQLFADGYYDAWAKLANTDSLDPKGIVSIGSDGEINLEVNDMSTDDVVEYLEKNLEISKETAELMLTDFENYSADLRQKLQANDFVKGFEDTNYTENRTGADGQIVLTLSEIKTIAAALGKEPEDIKEQIAEAANISKDQLKVIEDIDENGALVTDYAELSKQFSQAYVGANAGQYDWIKEYQKDNTYQVKEAIAGLQAKGANEDTALHLAYESFKEMGKDQEFRYDGQLLSPDEIQSYEDFVAAIEDFSENSHWMDVGEAIAEGYVGWMDNHEDSDKKDDSDKSDKKQTDSFKELKGLFKGTDGSYNNSKKKDTTTQTTPSDKSHSIRTQTTQQTPSYTTSVPSYGLDSAKAPKTLTTTIKTEIEGNPTKELEEKLNTPLIAKIKANTEAADAKIKEIAETKQTNVEFQPVSDKLDSDINYYENLDPALQMLLNPNDAVSPVLANIRSYDGMQIGVHVKAFNIENVRQKLLELSGLANRGAYTGLNNKIPVSHVPQMGSLARGTKKGRVGPRNQGGPTLTGEKGYEIAWIPSQSKSVILGANGPQMVNLPKEAVVYNHEQSEDILKRKAISAGSMAKGLGKKLRSKVKPATKTKKPLVSIAKSIAKPAAAITKTAAYSGLVAGSAATASAYKKRKSGGSGGGSGSGSGGSGGGSGSGGSSGSDKPKVNNINNFSVEEVYRFDLDRKIETYQSQVDKWGKDLDKTLAKIGTRASAISGNLNNQISYLKAIQKNNTDLAASYRRDLANLDTGNYKTKISYDKGGESQEEIVNLSSYIYKQSDGTYQIDKSKIASAGSKERQEAIFKAAEGALNPLVSGLKKAEDAAQAAQDAIDSLEKKIYDAFYGWENELTEIYHLTQRLENDSSLLDRFTSQVNLEIARLSAGFNTVTSAVQNSTAAMSRHTKTLNDQVKAQHQMITARKAELDAALTTQDELDKYLRIESKYGADSGITKQAAQEWDAANKAANYVSDVKMQADGSVTYNIDWAKFNDDQKKDPYNKETYDKIKAQLDNLNATSKAFNESIKDTTDILTESYNKLAEYQKTIADFEKTILDQLEKSIQEEIDNSKKLNDAIKTGFKDLLDQVKRKLDERRQKEDNAKTEQDIANKQQRLSLLRSSTNGSQVEIAQLEKEISDAQQSYQRTLEDQLLARLQQQEDLAAKQREQQIALAQASLDVQRSSNAELVNMWLKDPVRYQEQLEAAWMKAQDYEGKGFHEQQLLRQEFAAQFAELQTALFNTGELLNGSENLTLKQLEASGANLTTLVSLVQTLEAEIAKKNIATNPTTKNTTDKTTNTSIQTTSKPAAAAKPAAKPAATKPPAPKTDPITNDIKKGVASAIVNNKNYGGWGVDPTRKQLLTGVFGAKTAADIQKNYVNPIANGKMRAINGNAYTYDKQKNKKYTKYKKGGLAPFTGPAWLDGTQSKPELVLNATDTKNFIQLKDILASTMRAGAFNTPVAVSGDTNYEININVDHINNDYDVDKIANRVKKIIVQDSSYRNVTSVRKFR